MISEPPVVWALVFSNVLRLIAWGLLTAVGVRAYRQTNDSRIGIATLGFGVITTGTLFEAIYELELRDTFYTSGPELLVRHTIEGLIVTFGLALLFYSLSKYRGSD